MGLMLAVTRQILTGDRAIRAGRWAGSDKIECGIHVTRAEPSNDAVGGDI